MILVRCDNGFQISVHPSICQNFIFKCFSGAVIHL